MRRAGSNRFLKATGRWTRKVEAAFNFPSMLNAINTCILKGLRDAELVVRFKDDTDDRCYPVTPVL